jgi:hypothetical protein
MKKLKADPLRVYIPEPETFIRQHHLKPEPENWEDGIRLATDPGTFEWWYFDCTFEDGSTCVVVYYTKPLLKRRGPLRPSIQINITRPNGTRIKKVPVFHPKTFYASDKQCDVKIADNWVKGDLKACDIHAAHENVRVDLQMKTIIPTQRVGASRVYFEKNGEQEKYFFAWFPAIPYGIVHGTIVYDNIEHQVTGYGYHDHNFGNMSLPSAMSHWYWGRANIGDYHTIFLQLVTKAKYGPMIIPVFIFTHGPKVVLADNHCDVKAIGDVKHKDGRHYPEKMIWHCHKASSSAEITITQPQIIEARSLLEDFPHFIQIIAKWIVNPYYFRFRANMTIKVDLGETHEIVNGEGLYELMLLSGK